MSKIESCHIGRCYYISRENIQGNYCPDTGEYYLGIYDYTIIQGIPTEIGLAYYWYDEDGFCHVDSARGYSYDVVRELLRLGHLTRKTLADFIAAGGQVWWDQP